VDVAPKTNADRPSRRPIYWFLFSLSLVVILVGSLLAWWAKDQNQRAAVRILNAGENAPGVWIATDENGLKVMSNRTMMSSPFGTPSDIWPNTADDKLVFVPNHTRGIARGERFLLKGGRLVIPYSANSYDLQRDGAMEVEGIEIMEGPHKGVMGWAPVNYFQRLLTIGSL
jgi:hypothetical protein